MYNLASKLLDPLTDPLVLAILLLLCALLFWRWRRVALGLIAGALALLLVCSSKIGERALVVSLENQYRDTGMDVPPAQAIVVLGGAVRMPSGVHRSSGLTDGSDRLLTAFRLYRAGKAPVIFCSGGENPLTASQGAGPESVRMAELLEEWSIPAAAVRIETGSINTRENALRSFQVLAPLGIRRILLVTSAMHMPRAAATFRKAGFEVIAVPADFRSGYGEPSLLTRWIPGTGNLMDTTEALHEWLGVGIYRLWGWI